MVPRYFCGSATFDLWIFIEKSGICTTTIFDYKNVDELLDFMKRE